MREGDRGTALSRYKDKFNPNAGKNVLVLASRDMAAFKSKAIKEMKEAGITGVEVREYGLSDAGFSSEHSKSKYFAAVKQSPLADIDEKSESPAEDPVRQLQFDSPPQLESPPIEDVALQQIIAEPPRQQSLLSSVINFLTPGSSEKKNQ